MKYIIFASVLSTVLIIAVLLAKYVSKRFGFSRFKTTAIFVVVSLMYTLSLLYFFGVAAITVKGILFLFILLISSSGDLKIRECDDYIHLMIVIAAFIGTEIKQIPGMILSGIFVMIIMLASVILAKGKMGGADIKLSSACAFLLGIQKGLTGLFIGLLLAIVINLIKGKNKNNGFPLIPYLSFGFGLAFLI